MGGAMDLVAGAKNVIVAMQHTDKEGNSKLRTKCTLPLTGLKCIKKIVSDFGVIEITPKGFVLLEYAPDMTAEQVVKATEGQISIHPECKKMVF
jgi:3-oxoacid CoA-transferase subunit B